MTATGAGVSLAIQLELDKVLSSLNGGVDLSTAVDGNNDGTITISPEDAEGSDGNKQLADQIMMLLTRHAHCDKKKD